MKHKEKTAEIFFESLNAPALYIQMQAVLALYSTGMKFLGLFWSLLKKSCELRQASGEICLEKSREIDYFQKFRKY